MSLASLGFDRCMRFYCISDDACPAAVGPEHDLLIGRNKSVTMTINNGSTMQVRGIVVLGSFILSSTSLESPTKGALKARDIIVAGNMSGKHAELTCGLMYQANNIESFKQSLETLIFDYLRYQRACAGNMGLKSVLLDL